MSFLIFLLSRIQEPYVTLADHLPSELSAARMEGLPLVPNDLRPARHPLLSQNAAPLYQQVLTAWYSLPKAQREEIGELDTLLKSRNPTDQLKAHSIVESRRRELALTEAAVQLPGCDFNRQYEQGPALVFPEYPSLRDMARLLAARAILEGRKGDLKKAFQTITAGAKMGRHIGLEPTLIARLVSVAVYAMMDRAFQDVVFSNLHRAELIPLAESAARFPPHPDSAHAFSSEVAMVRITLQMIQRDPNGFGMILPNDLNGLIASVDPRRRAMMTAAWEARSIQYWRRWYAGFRQHPHDLIAQYHIAKGLADEAESKAKEPTYELTAILMPFFHAAILKMAGVIEQERLRETLVDLVRYEQVHNQWPPSVAQLPTRPGPDIFTGKPPIYRKTRNGFILYSVGDDFKDNGGNARAENQSAPFDIVIQHPPTGR